MKIPKRDVFSTIISSINAQKYKIKVLMYKDYCAIFFFFFVLRRLACSENILSTNTVIFFRLCVPVDSVLWPDHTFPQL